MTNNYVKNFRKRFGWSQRKLSEESGISINAIQNWESGKTKYPKWVGRVFGSILYDLPTYEDHINDK